MGLVDMALKINCEGKDHGCKEIYIGETKRSLKQRFQEHVRRSSIWGIQVLFPGHMVKLREAEILAKGPLWLQRGIKEATYIRPWNQPSTEIMTNPSCPLQSNHLSKRTSNSQGFPNATSTSLQLRKAGVMDKF